MARGDQGAANTWNKHLSALTSCSADCRRQDWPATDPGRRLERRKVRRKVTRTRDKAIPRARLDRLFTADRNPLRERVLWRMLYETCARAEEILSPTPHQLRHSGLTRLAAKGRSAAELQAGSRHRHLATLGIHVRLGEETSTRITAENDEHHWRHRR
ncbi:tyrosine-type recombinase/integrase [Streptomyces calidiresistens]|nr:tyrosine-type recombinase/integrase [Streptomyces calidiresistens]